MLSALGSLTPSCRKCSEVLFERTTCCLARTNFQCQCINRPRLFKWRMRGASIETAMPNREAGNVIAFYLYHDASVAFSKNGRVQCVLELERFFEERYYKSHGWQFSTYMEECAALFEDDWLRALNALQETCECDDGACPVEFEHGVLVRTWEVEPETFSVIPAVVSKVGMPRTGVIAKIVKRVLTSLHIGSAPKRAPQVFTVHLWQYANHSEAHALMGFHTFPFRSALVLAIGNGANDGALNAYKGQGLDVQGPIARLDYNMGGAYNILGLLLEEVAGSRQTELCEALETQPDAGHFS